MKKRTRNFWELAHYGRRVLPKETINYIPKFIAAVMIAENPAKYGFTDIDFQPAFTFDSVVVEKPISLEMLSAQLKVDYDEMKLMNPRYKSDYVPIYSDRVNAVRVPVGMKDQTIASIDKCLSDAPKRYVASFEYYRIRRGETLSHIAKRFHTSVAKLRDLNDLSRRTMIRAGKKIKVPEKYDKAMVKAKTSGDDDSPSDTESAPEKSTSTIKSSPTSLRRGVARQSSREKRTVASVHKSTNSGTVNKATLSKVAKAEGDRRIHVIRRGENLSTIARRYKVTISQIAKANALSRRSKLIAGRELLIPD